VRNGGLSATGYQLFAINPLAVARYRDRHHVSGTKPDASDAKLLADLGTHPPHSVVTQRVARVLPGRAGSL
jgi:hypothetical protein